jgi:hypothetical protein
MSVKARGVVRLVIASCVAAGLSADAEAGTVSITATTFDRIPAKTSQSALSSGGASYFCTYKNLLDFKLTAGLHLYIEVSNDSATAFSGYLSYSYLIDPQGKKHYKNLVHRDEVCGIALTCPRIMCQFTLESWQLLPCLA